MYFIPDHTLNIVKESDFPSAIADIEQTLAKHMHTGSFTAFDNAKIHYEYFLAQNSRASVVIVHGLSEFTKKFYELTYYLLNQGYNVFIYDQRCHGLSDRLTDNIDHLHVDDFYDYVKDLSQFIDSVVIPADDKPLYLYSHSMGGAVCALYLAQQGNKIKKAVFSAPLFDPVVTDVPPIIARWSVWLGKTLLGSKKRFFISKDFNPETEYKQTFCSSKARFDYNMKLRKENVYFQSTPMTFGWVYNSLIIRSRIFSRKVIDNIKTPILLLSAEDDATVRNEPQVSFAEKCPCCKLVKIEKAHHALLSCNNETLSKIIKLVLDFYD